MSITPARGRLFRARGVAEYLGISEFKARALIRAGDLVAVRSTSGRLEGVYEADCEAWVTAHRQRATPVSVGPAVDDRIAQLPGAGYFS